jgi:hypothetical protein
LRAQALVHESVKRETLYSEFIIEASKCLADAWSHHAESPEVIARLYSVVQRMRLTSSDEVISVAEKVIRLVIEAYAESDKTFDELRERVAASQDEYDPLREFSEVCRLELLALRG